MSTPSQWPLHFNAVRTVLPHFVVRKLAGDPFTKSCYLLAFGYYPWASGHFMRRSQHDDNLLIYCVEGLGHITTSHFSGSVGKGQLLLLPAGVSHSYRADNRTPWTIYWCHFAAYKQAELLQHLHYSHQHPVFDIGMEPQMVGDFKKIIGTRRRGLQIPYAVYASCVLHQLLGFMAVKVADMEAPARHDFDLEAIEGLMLNNLDGQLDLDSLAAFCNLSKFHFASKYKSLTGMPPISHFIYLKMERACYLLDTTHRNIKQISAELGYEDPLYFSRQFRKVIGLSPKDYRSKRRG